jgi:hypothetical protein
MTERQKRNMGWWVTIILFTAAGIGAGYLLGLKNKPQERLPRPPAVSDTAPVEKEVPTEAGPPLVEAPEEGPVTTGNTEERRGFPEYSCQEIEKDIQAFFQYLGSREEIRRLAGERDLWDLFTDLTVKLSLNPPIPAGEGLSSSIMIENIFHFYRTLDKEEISLIKSVLVNEMDNFEWHLHLFYTWLMSGNRCPGVRDHRPSFEVLYHYAGFLTNSIGGRACTFRRPLGLRLLVSYYSLRIIYEADLRGENSYGIDIFPQVAQILKEMSVYPALHFRDEYIGELMEIQSYYLERR